MMKKATLLLVLISMCLITTAGIGAVSANDEPIAGVTAGIINSDGTITVLKTFEGSGFLSANVSKNDDGSITIVKEDRDGITEYTFEDGNVIADTLKPSERIDASARTVYYQASGNNVRYGLTCSASSDNVNGYACADVADGYARCWRD